MYRVLFYQNNISDEQLNQNSKQKLATWIDGIYSHNEIPYPILYSRERLVCSNTKKVILEKGQPFIEIDVAFITQIEYHEQGSTVFLSNKSFWLTNKKIDQFEEELKGSLFLRVHTNHIVNLRHMENFVKCDAFITLSTNDAIPVDSKSKEMLKKFLNDKQIL
ncbi:MAG: LytTR family transcriptional regulator DNA-binding domain-containing protein [Bacteroidales bacterium]|nr:LytTR family transcriptional regulator DNA-binding domain-containing protein [Bacteroidales bacterium]